MPHRLSGGTLVGALLLLLLAACEPVPWDGYDPYYDPYPGDAPYYEIPRYCRSARVTALTPEITPAWRTRERDRIERHLGRGLWIDDPDVYGRGRGSFLYHHALWGDPAMVRYLLDLGASVRALNRNGRTPLHAAVEGCHNAVAALLIDAGADPYAHGLRADISPYALAERTGQREMLSIFGGLVGPWLAAPRPRVTQPWPWPGWWYYDDYYYDDRYYRRHRPRYPRRPRPPRPHPPGQVPPPAPPQPGTQPLDREYPADLYPDRDRVRIGPPRDREYPADLYPDRDRDRARIRRERERPVDADRERPRARRDRDRIDRDEDRRPRATRERSADRPARAPTTAAPATRRDTRAAPSRPSPPSAADKSAPVDVAPPAGQSAGDKAYPEDLLPPGGQRSRDR